MIAGLVSHHGEIEHPVHVVAPAINPILPPPIVLSLLEIRRGNVEVIAFGWVLVGLWLNGRFSVIVPIDEKKEKKAISSPVNP